jgi:hypothetical protein
LSFRNIAQVFSVVCAKSVELFGAIAANYFDVKWGNFVLVFVLLEAKL